MKNYLLFFLTLFSLASAIEYRSYSPNQSLDTHMSPEDEEDTGLNKLTPQEKQALQNWINAHHYIKASSQVRPHQDLTPEVSEVLGNGSYVKLSDKTLWKIHPNDRNITYGWITPVDIIVKKNGTKNYPYTLTNSLTGSTVRAQKATTLPEGLIQKPQQLQQPKKPQTEHEFQQMQKEKMQKQQQEQKVDQYFESAPAPQSKPKPSSKKAPSTKSKPKTQKPSTFN